MRPLGFVCTLFMGLKLCGPGDGGTVALSTSMAQGRVCACLHMCAVCVSNWDSRGTSCALGMLDQCVAGMAVLSQVVRVPHSCARTCVPWLQGDAARGRVLSHLVDGAVEAQVRPRWRCAFLANDFRICFCE